MQVLGNAGFAPIRTGQLSADGACGVSVVAKIDRAEYGMAEIRGIMKRPESRFKAFDDPA